MMTKSTKFTLLELLIVIGIIAILLTLLLPSLRNARMAAELAVDLSNQNQIYKGMMIYAQSNDNQLLLPEVDMPWAGYRASSAKLVKEKPEHIGYLYSEGIISDSKVFYCPIANRSPITGFRHKDYMNSEGEWGPYKGGEFGGFYTRAGYFINSLHYKSLANIKHKIDSSQFTKNSGEGFDSDTSEAPFIYDWIMTLKTQSRVIFHGESWCMTTLDGSGRIRRSKALVTDLEAGLSNFSTSWADQAWALHELMK